MTCRRGALLAMLAAAMGGGALPGGVHALAPGAPAGIIRPRSLAKQLRGAVLARKPLVVLVSLAHCPYCTVVRESHLVPLHAAGQPVVEVDMGSQEALTDLHGQDSTHQQVAKDWRVRLAPTVLFLGREGREVAARLEGLGSVDFYGAYLEQRLEAANRSIAPR